ncbi:hypothetical protein [Kitasatospora herbaricolor]|uniref:hypothetical protein n=1 Tax=Kitasatospora herbaricolor TaxID=68217 RepID=UPI002E2F2FB3|nr:hypothetical protein [Kitasatospora herbaricolor]
MSRVGKLRVYLGAAPGVGKTYAMLAEGRRLRQGGLDVVVGLVETYGRRGTEEQLGDLPFVARSAVRYRGVELTELDVEGVLARRPGLALVDELAHSNAPGRRNSKRTICEHRWPRSRSRPPVCSPSSTLNRSWDCRAPVRRRRLERAGLPAPSQGGGLRWTPAGCCRSLSSSGWAGRSPTSPVRWG